MHSKDFEKIRGWYRKGIYTVAQLEKLVEKGKITQEEMDLIIRENADET